MTKTITQELRQLMTEYNLNLKFDAGKKVLTKRGEAFVYSAKPDENFWNAWREFKDDIKSIGISVTKIKEEFVVNFWSDVPDYIVKEQEKFIEMSKKEKDNNITLNVPENLCYLNYQKVGIQYALEKQSCLIADEMGLGKTIQAIGVINNDESINKVLIICPASIKKNWENELKKWLIKNMSISIITGKSSQDEFNSQILIINYDIVGKHINNLSKNHDLLICDESQYLKNYKSARTEAVTQLAKKCKKKLLLTGTPILNRPNEVLSQLMILGDVAMKNFNNNIFTFLNRYCATGDKHNQYDGAKNLDELNNILRANCMVLRKKKDVLKDLPPKFRKIIKLQGDGIVQAEKQALKKHQESIELYAKALKKLKKVTDKYEYERQAAELRSVRPSDIAEITELRHKTATAKIPYVIEYLKEFLESTENDNRKIVVFAHHKDVIEAIYTEFINLSVKIDGTTDTNILQSIVDKFQTDNQCRIFIGSLHAASTGITLTAASDVLFAEIDWTPAILSQAEDRCHRIGQENCVSIQHLVFDGSIDGMLIDTILEKQKIIDEFTA